MRGGGGISGSPPGAFPRPPPYTGGADGDGAATCAAASPAEVADIAVTTAMPAIIGTPHRARATLVVILAAHFPHFPVFPFVMMSAAALAGRAVAQ